MFKFVHSFIIGLILMEFQGMIPKTGAELYSGYKVLNVIPRSPEQLQYLQILASSTERLENIRFWNTPVESGTAIIEVSSEGFESLKTILERNNITYWISIDDLQRQINIEQKENLQQLSDKDAINPELFSMDRYHNLEEIYLYLDALKSPKEDIKLEVVTFGQSIENRPLKVVKIQKYSDANRPIILLEAGSHAREWISPASALYLISKMTENSEEGLALLENFDWLIIPVLNPDGYVYSWTKDRLWRKNRRIYSPVDLMNSRCNGVDLNRNYDIGDFSKISPGGGFCTDVYAGTEPFSEPETRALRDLVLPLKSRIKLYLSLHNFFQMWVTPYLYKMQYPENFVQMNLILSKAINAMSSVNGNSYTSGPGSILKYPADGTSLDWFYEKLNVSYAFILELPDKGQFGFLLPRDRIIPVGREVTAAMKVLVSELSKV